MNLITSLKKKNNVDLFTTPTHAQKKFLLSKLKQFYKWDISENDAYNPQEALNFSQKRAAEIYDTKSTFYLTNGSTSGVIVAVLTCVKEAEKVLIWNNSHPSHLNAIKLAGAVPVFYTLEKDNDWGIYKETPPEIIKNILKSNNTPSQPSLLGGEGEVLGELASRRNSGEGYITAVIVTSPTYEGIVSDVAKIKQVCQKYGAYLIVDEAHGALYPFCDKLSTSAIYQNADFVIQSLHKTAGGLNPTALLHCNTVPSHCETGVIGSDQKHPPKQSICHIDIQSALDKISTTSPSYPLLASIEKNVNYLNSKKGRNEILQLIKNIENLKNNVSNCEFYPNNDPTKILIRTPELNGFELSEFLYKNKIEDERTNEKSTMLLCGIGTDLKKLKRLEKVLKKL